MRIAAAAQMREMDRAAIEERGIPSVLLMERAAAALAGEVEALAGERGIDVQMDVIRSGGTDAGSIYTTKMGVLTGGISIPCRYVHTPQEMVDRGDVEACARLVCAFAEASL